jgi:hypothetical protein
LIKLLCDGESLSWLRLLGAIVRLLRKKVDDTWLLSFG